MPAETEDLTRSGQAVARMNAARGSGQGARDRKRAELRARRRSSPTYFDGRNGSAYWSGRADEAKESEARIEAAAAEERRLADRVAALELETVQLRADLARGPVRARQRHAARTIHFDIRLNPEEHETIQAAAQFEHEPASTLARRVTVKACRELLPAEEVPF